GVAGGGMEDERDLKELQIDALREVANIGAGHAATALSQLTNRKIMISVPQINIVRLEEVPDLLGNPQDVVAAVLMHMLGDLTGRTLLLFPESVGRRVCDMLLRRPVGTTAVFDALEQSCLKEAGNILAGAYLNALSDFMGMLLLPSVPSLVVDLSAAVLTTTYLNFGHERDFVFCVETEFTIDSVEGLRGAQQSRRPLLSEGSRRGCDRGVHARARAGPEDAGRAAQPRNRLSRYRLLRPARGAAAGAAAPGARRPRRSLGAGTRLCDSRRARGGGRRVRAAARPQCERRGGDHSARAGGEKSRAPRSRDRMVSARGRARARLDGRALLF